MTLQVGLGLDGCRVQVGVCCYGIRCLDSTGSSVAFRRVRGSGRFCFVGCLGLGFSVWVWG